MERRKRGRPRRLPRIITPALPSACDNRARCGPRDLWTTVRPSVSPPPAPALRQPVCALGLHASIICRPFPFGLRPVQAAPFQPHPFQPRSISAVFPFPLFLLPLPHGQTSTRPAGRRHLFPRPLRLRGGEPALREGRRPCLHGPPAGSAGPAGQGRRGHAAGQETAGLQWPRRGRTACGRGTAVAQRSHQRHACLPLGPPSWCATGTRCVHPRPSALRLPEAAGGASLSVGQCRRRARRAGGRLPGRPRLPAVPAAGRIPPR